MSGLIPKEMVDSFANSTIGQFLIQGLNQLSDVPLLGQLAGLIKSVLGWLGIDVDAFANKPENPAAEGTNDLNANTNAEAPGPQGPGPSNGPSTPYIQNGVEASELVKESALYTYGAPVKLGDGFKFAGRFTAFSVDADGHFTEIGEATPGDLSQLLGDGDKYIKLAGPPGGATTGCFVCGEDGKGVYVGLDALTVSDEMIKALQAPAPVKPEAPVPAQAPTVMNELVGPPMIPSPG